MPDGAEVERRSAPADESEWPVSATADRPIGMRRSCGRGRLKAGDRVRRQGDSAVLADGMLKLMLILLAFFVYLHGRSEPSEKRATEVLHSLAAQFARIPATLGGHELAPAGEAFDWANDLRRRLIGHLPITARPIEAPDTLLGFDITEAELFDSRDGSVLREQRVLLHRLAEAVESDAPGGQLVLVITAPATIHSTGLGHEDFAKRLGRRLSAVATVLAQAGLSWPHLRLGLEPLPADIWRFAIRMERPDAS